MIMKTHTQQTQNNTNLMAQKIKEQRDRNAGAVKLRPQTSNPAKPKTKLERLADFEVAGKVYQVGTNFSEKPL